MDGSIQRAKQLIDLAGRTEGIPTDLICFAVAPILREGNIDCIIVCDLFYYETHRALDDMETQTFLKVSGQFVDAAGAYSSIEDAAKEQQRITRSKKVCSDGHPVFHEPEEEAYAAYERFGYTEDEMTHFVNILRSRDQAATLKQSTSGIHSSKSKIRL